jgi:hypothetical protein
MAANLGVAKSTFQLWEATYPEFSASLERAMTLSQMWWEDKGQENIDADKFQAAMWSRSMAARFPDDWRETSRQERTGPDGGPQQLNVTGDAVADLTRRLARLASPGSAAGSTEGSE